MYNLQMYSCTICTYRYMYVLFIYIYIYIYQVGCKPCCISYICTHVCIERIKRQTLLNQGATNFVPPLNVQRSCTRLLQGETIPPRDRDREREKWREDDLNRYGSYHLPFFLYFAILHFYPFSRKFELPFFSLHIGNVHMYNTVAIVNIVNNNPELSTSTRLSLTFLNQSHHWVCQTTLLNSIHPLLYKLFTIRTNLQKNVVPLVI